MSAVSSLPKHLRRIQKMITIKNKLWSCFKNSDNKVEFNVSFYAKSVNNKTNNIEIEQ